MGGTKKPALNDHAGGTDLKNMIDFNKQYILTNELFKGDSQAFQAAVKRINESPTIEAAFEFIKTELMPRYKWGSEMQSARLFDKLVRQKFGMA
jgi:U3 small nucleolar RNA-associated protein 14